ncbi:MAG: hypothetical protein J6P13_04200 [Kiritimatiellae bacterium]|nr:hypothetical protein [Kiritimatiellia bacterium]
MKTASTFGIVPLLALASTAMGAELKISADRMAADNITGTVVASGHVHAVSQPYNLFSELATKKGEEYTFEDPTMITTCTNSHDSLHWSVTGSVRYRTAEDVLVKNLVLRAYGIPVMWFPLWYYPMNTDYGLRVMPGYSSRWGAYLLTKYVYHIAGSYEDGRWNLGGTTRVDLRTKNGIAFGQGFRWQLGDFGRGMFKAYYAWDRDADHYDHHWRSPRSWHYENWGSKVHEDRYAFMLKHLWEATERDTLRVKGAYYSDSHFRSNFLRSGLFGTRNRFLGYEGNEMALEHVENGFGAGISVSGPLNRFYDGVSRLPEAYLDIQPTPVFNLGINYESASTIGFYNRDNARHGDKDTLFPFRYAPGIWADYQTFRFDTYHRLTLPMRFWDVLSVVPRAGLRGTYWADTGRESLDGYSRATSSGNGTTRTIVEGGITFSARGTAWFGEDESWLHSLEPYFDVLAQEAKYHNLKRGTRPYIFDSADASRDWLDQFAGRSRNLPYSWYGFTPGLRNALRHADEKGNLRTVLDFDVYGAVQLNDTSYTEGGRYHALARKPSDPNYSRHEGFFTPGMRLRWFPDDDCALSSRIEYDTHTKNVAYASLAWNQKLSKSLKWQASLYSRDHRYWDFSSAPYDSDALRNEDFNMAKYTFASVSFEHELCDALAWGPFVSWDCREDELDEIGAWFDVRTDCLGFRFSVSYENDYKRVDWSESKDDWRFGFYIYLRALGPESGSAF